MSHTKPLQTFIRETGPRTRLALNTPLLNKQNLSRQPGSMLDLEGTLPDMKYFFSIFRVFISRIRYMII